MLKNNKKAGDALIMLCYTCAFGAFGAFFRWLQMQVARDTETGLINPSILNILLPLFGLPLVGRILFLHQLPNFTADGLLLHACHPAYLSKVNITLNLTVQLCKDFRRLCGKANPVLRIFEIIFALYAGNFKGYIMHSIHQQLGKFRCALCLDKFIGILIRSQIKDTNRKSCFFQDRYRSQYRSLSRLITVK